MRSGQEASRGGWWALSVRTRTSLTLTSAYWVQHRYSQQEYDRLDKEDYD